METVTQDSAVVESSPTFEVPRDPKANAHWRMTGEMPAEPKKEESAPSNSSAEKSAEKPAPVSETGTQHQEPKNKPRDNAGARLNELLSDLREAGLSPAELKTFKQNYQRKEAQQAEPQKSAAPEKTDNPASELKPPTKPKLEDFKTYEEYETAKDKYFEDMADFKAAKAVQDFRQQQAQDAAQQTVKQKIDEARTRYGNEGVDIIASVGPAIAGDKQIHPAVIGIINDSPVWPDLCYTLGQKPEDLAAFVNLARTNPGEAIRKVVLMENLIKTELSKGSKSEAKEEAPRGEDGKFQKAPEKRESKAPPPPAEVSGRGTAPPDEEATATRNGDFKTLQRLENQRELAARRR